jgi:hypothetical protein
MFCHMSEGHALRRDTPARPISPDMSMITGVGSGTGVSSQRCFFSMVVIIRDADETDVM